jgi:hypothetical protein
MSLTSVVFLGDKESIQQAKDWLRICSQPESKLMDYWQKTTRSRLAFIHGGKEVAAMVEILQEWPRYKDRRGHVLVFLFFILFYLTNSRFFVLLFTIIMWHMSVLFI